MPKSVLEILEESTETKPFRFKGIAMIEDSLSGNGRFFSKKLVNATVDSVNQIIESTGSYPLNVMAGHPGVADNKTLTTVGKITAMYMDGKNAIIEAEIANTTYGKDVQELIRGKFVEGLSIRASNAKMQKMNINGKMVNDVLEMELKGVDLVTNPGVKGARVTEILESDETNSGIFISIEEEEIINPVNIEEDKPLNYSEIVLEELKKQRPDLVAVLKDEFKPVLESELKVNELTESVNDLTTKKGELQEELETVKTEKGKIEEELSTAKTSLEEAEKQLKEIREAEEAAKLAKEKAEREAHIAEELGKLKYADSIKEKIKGKLEVLESVEAIDAQLAEEVAFLDMVIQESTGIKLQSKGHPGNNQNDVNEDEDFMNIVMGM